MTKLEWREDRHAYFDFWISSFPRPSSFPDRSSKSSKKLDVTLSPPSKACELQVSMPAPLELPYEENASFPASLSCMSRCFSKTPSLTPRHRLRHSWPRHLFLHRLVD